MLSNSCLVLPAVVKQQQEEISRNILICRLWLIPTINEKEEWYLKFQHKSKDVQCDWWSRTWVGLTSSQKASEGAFEVIAYMATDASMLPTCTYLYSPLEGSGAVKNVALGIIAAEESHLTGVLRHPWVAVHGYIGS